MRLIDADDFGNRMYHEAFVKDSDLQKWDSGCWIRYKLFENVLREQPTVQPDHVADIGKKVSISCGQENDLISRQAAIDALARMMPRSYTPDGSHPRDEEIFGAQEIYVDCIEAIEILPSAQPEIVRCKDCRFNTYSKKCLNPDSFFLVPADDFYCGYAERRTNE